MILPGPVERAHTSVSAVRLRSVACRCVGGSGRCVAPSARSAAAGHSAAAAATSSSANARPLGRCVDLILRDTQITYPQTSEYLDEVPALPIVEMTPISV